MPPARETALPRRYSTADRPGGRRGCCRFGLARGPERLGGLFVEGEKVFGTGAFGGEGGAGLGKL